MYILKIPILTHLDDGGYNYRKEAMSINLDHLVYVYSTRIKVNRISGKKKGGWKTIDDKEFKVNELMLTRRNGGGPIYTTVDIHSSIDWILHSGPGFYDLTK